MSKESHEVKKEEALLVSIYKGNKNKAICLEHLEELALLAETYGVTVLGKSAWVIRRFDDATYMTKGKLEELVALSEELKADIVIIDDEITAAQQRNLEIVFKKPVLDRTGVILEVFAQRAQTKEARLQVELAQVKYQAPRLKKMWSHLSRQAGTGSSGGGGAYLKGEGEKQIEIDRRLMDTRIDQLNQEIKEVCAHRETQRMARQRSEIPVFGIIGYTNAGKSTLLNALTDAEVFVENKLFATLDTTTRKFTLSNNQDILLIDTVGFIRKLPHLLVAAFKSTLEEAVKADFLLHLIDASHPMAEEQAITTFEVLQQLGAGKKSIITVLNKVDLCQDKDRLHKLQHLYPLTVQISALNKTGFDDLAEMMISELAKLRTKVDLCIPQKDYGVVSDVIRLGHVISQEYVENDIYVTVDLPREVAGKFEKYMINCE